MPTSNNNNRHPLPVNWTDYESGGRRASGASQTSHVQFADDDESHHENDHLMPRAGFRNNQGELRKRRSSMSMRISSIRHAGGVNSIDNFARSWQRAAGFFEITPVRPSFVYSETGEEDEEAAEDGEETQPRPQQDHRGLLRQALEADGRRASDNVIAEEGPGPSLSRNHSDVSAAASSEQGTVRARRGDSILQVEPSLASPFGGSYGTTYGSLAARVPESSMRHAGRLFRQQQMQGVTAPDKEREPLLVKQVEEDDGKVVNVVVGQSTLPQTVFNSVNVLIGVGILALPLALQYSGWVIGIIFLIWAALVTSYTAKILAKCLDVDNSLITFADLAYVSFGSSARIATSVLFSLELLATCVALVVLFADSLDALIPGLDPISWKCICGILLIPLAFLPLRLLSFTSVLGIISCFGIVIAVFVDGLIKPNTPGSLREPARTHLFPQNWTTIPISLGLLMSPWGGHSVFPNIYRDMRHPYKYRRSVNVTYIATATLDIFMAVVGLLMFGDSVRDEITSNIFLTDGYPEWLSVVICICVAIIPLTKIPLNARPIISTLEVLLGLDARAIASTSALQGISGFWRGIFRASLRIIVTVIFVLFAILIPSFDRIMSLLGSVACFSICIILPLAFHLKIFGKEIPKMERIGNWVLIVVSTIMAIVSTVFNFIPKEVLDIKEPGHN